MIMESTPQQQSQFRVPQHIPSDTPIGTALQQRQRGFRKNTSGSDPGSILIHEESLISMISVLPSLSSCSSKGPFTGHSVSSDEDMTLSYSNTVLACDKRDDALEAVLLSPTSPIGVCVPLSPPSSTFPFSLLSPLDQILEAIEDQSWTLLGALLCRFLEADDSLVHRMVRLTCQGETEQGTLLHLLILTAPKTVPYRIIRLLLDYSSSTDGAAGASEGSRTHIARIPDSKGNRLPLHMCLLKGCPLNVTKAVLEAYPEATMEKDDQGNLPLHYAAMYQNYHVANTQYASGSRAPLAGRQDELFRLILTANPEAAKKANHRERWPLHLLAASCWLEDSRPSDDTTLSGLVRSSSCFVAKRRSSNGSDLAKAAAKQSTNVSGALVSSCVSVARSSASSGDETDDGYEPSIDACPVVRNIRACIEAYPLALELGDRTGFLPLHLACNQAFLRHDVLKVLIGSYPAALMVETKTEKTPYQLAELTYSPSLSHGSNASSTSPLLLQYLKECTQQERRKMSTNPLIRWNMGGISTAAVRRRRRRRFAPLRPHSINKTGVDLYHCYG